MLIILRCSLYILLSLLPLSAPAQSPCGSFEKAIDDRLRISTFNKIVANSATDGVEAFAMISINIRLMEANRCGLPKVPITGNEYSAAATSCLLAIMKARTEAIPQGSYAERQVMATAREKISECKIEDWKRS